RAAPAVSRTRRIPAAWVGSDCVIDESLERSVSAFFAAFLPVFGSRREPAMRSPNPGGKVVVVVPAPRMVVVVPPPGVVVVVVAALALLFVNVGDASTKSLRSLPVSLMR